MNDKFLALVNKYNQDLLLIKHEPEKYTKKLQTFYPFVSSLYSQEVETLFTEIQLNKEIKKWQGAKELVKSVDSFEIDYQAKKISVKLGDESFASDLIEIKTYLAQELNQAEDTWQYSLILSFFCDPQVYEMFQLTRSISA